MATIDDEQLSYLEKTIKIIKKYGIAMVFKALIVIAAFGYIIINVSKFDDIVNQAILKNDEDKITAHDKALEYRRSISPKIDDILNKTLNTLNADRAFVLELHNGTNNTAGLPFIYAEMTYCVVNDGISHIDDDYINLNLSRFYFPLYLVKKDVWFGKVNELKKIDAKLANRLISNDVKYMCIVTLHGLNNDLGYFGITYCRDYEPNTDELVKKIMSTSQKLSNLLDHK